MTGSRCGPFTTDNQNRSECSERFSYGIAAQTLILGCVKSKRRENNAPKEWDKYMEKFVCPCCGCRTLDERGVYDICPVCFWEDDAYLVVNNGELKGVRVDNDIPDEALLDVPSGANNGLTLREGRKNYRKFGACDEKMKRHVRKPKENELPQGKTDDFL